MATPSRVRRTAQPDALPRQADQSRIGVAEEGPDRPCLITVDIDSLSVVGSGPGFVRACPMTFLLQGACPEQRSGLTWAGYGRGQAIRKMARDASVPIARINNLGMLVTIVSPVDNASEWSAMQARLASAVKSAWVRTGEKV